MKIPIRSTLGRSACFVALTLFLSGLAPVTGWTAIPESEILADSVIELRETATSGSYQTLAVTLATRDGRSTLVARKDRAETRVDLPVKESLRLWKTVLELGIEELADTTSRRLPPDQSRFTVTIRAAGADHTFVTYGVDSLADRRYRAIVREILHLTDSRAYGKAWRK